MFLRDRRATTSPVRGDRQAFFIPGVPRRHFNSTCRSTLHRFRLPRTFQTTEGGRYPDRFLPSIFVYKLTEGKFSGQNALPDMKYHYFHNQVRGSEHTVYVRIEARASISFQAILTRPLFEPGFYSSPASIKVHGNFVCY